MDSEIEVENYVCIRKDRNRHGGGVAMYIRNDIAHDVRSDLSHNELEALWVNILLPKTKPILVGVCYRPPNQNNFYSYLEDMCSNANGFLNNEVIITGDFNTNVSSVKSNSLLSALRAFSSFFDLQQIICQPTRICTTSQSVIDLIFVSDQGKISQSGVIQSGMSDHMITYCTRKYWKHPTGHHNTIKVRSMKHYSKMNLWEKLSAVNWMPVLNCHNVDEAWNNFKDIFLGGN